MNLIEKIKRLLSPLRIRQFPFAITRPEPPKLKPAGRKISQHQQISVFNEKGGLIEIRQL